MKKRTRVVVYGSSLNMAGVAASLKAEPDLEVVCINSHTPASRQTLHELDPALIAFDLSDPTPGVDVTLLRERPGLLLVGVDPAKDEMLVLSGRAQRAVAVADLLRVVRESRRARDGEGGGGDTVTRRRGDTVTRRGGEGKTR